MVRLSWFAGLVFLGLIASACGSGGETVAPSDAEVETDSVSGEIEGGSSGPVSDGLSDAVAAFSDAGRDFSPEAMKEGFGECEQLDTAPAQRLLEREVELDPASGVLTNTPRYQSCTIQGTVLDADDNFGSVTYWFAPDLNGTEQQEGLVVDNWDHLEGDLADMTPIEGLGDAAGWTFAEYPGGYSTTLRVQQGGTDSMISIVHPDREVPVTELIEVLADATEAITG